MVLDYFKQFSLSYSRHIKNYTLIQYLHSLTANMVKSAEKIAKNIKLNKFVDEYEDKNGEYNLLQLAELYGVSKTSIFRSVSV